MRKAVDRAKALGRIVAVQADMVRLADARLASARRDRDRSVEDLERLSAFVAGDASIGPTFSKAVLRTSKVLEGRRAAAEQGINDATSALQAAKRRDRAVSRLASDANRAARREAEAKDLEELIDAWHARGTSLP